MFTGSPHTARTERTTSQVGGDVPDRQEGLYPDPQPHPLIIPRVFVAVDRLSRTHLYSRIRHHRLALSICSPSLRCLPLLRSHTDILLPFTAIFLSAPIDPIPSLLFFPPVRQFQHLFTSVIFGSSAHPWSTPLSLPKVSLRIPSQLIHVSFTISDLPRLVATTSIDTIPCFTISYLIFTCPFVLRVSGSCCFSFLIVSFCVGLWLSDLSVSLSLSSVLLTQCVLAYISVAYRLYYSHINRHRKICSCRSYVEPFQLRTNNTGFDSILKLPSTTTAVCI